MCNYEDISKRYAKSSGFDYALPYHSTAEDNISPGITPQMLYKHYGYDPNKDFTGKNISIGIVTAFGNDTIQEDLYDFSKAFFLPQTKLSIVKGTRKAFCTAHTKDLWALETALDAEWAHAFAPDAEIKCYFADSDDFNDIFYMIKKAGNECDIVSLSFGKTEFAGQTEYEKNFADSKALFICASGGSKKVCYPAASSSVIAVGGTSIYFDRDGSLIGNESIWQDSCYGQSRYINIPEHQKNLSDIELYNKKFRTIPDLSFFAYGNKGAAVYFKGKRKDVFGTSISAPCIAGFCACIAQADKSILTEKAAYFYNLSKKYTDFKNKHNCFLRLCHSQNNESICFDIRSGLGVPDMSEILKNACSEKSFG